MYLLINKNVSTENTHLNENENCKDLQATPKNSMDSAKESKIQTAIIL